MRSAITATLLWAVALVASAAEVPTSAPVHSLVRVKLEAGERATVLSAALVPVDSVRTYDGLVFTGPAGRYAVLVIGAEDVETKFVEIKGSDPLPPGPTPPVPPDPLPPSPEPLDGVGSRLYPVIKQMSDKPSMLKLAANYRSVLDRLNTGEIVSVQVARTALSRGTAVLTLTQQWKPVIEAMVGELNAVGGDVNELKKAMRGTIAALELAAK